MRAVLVQPQARDDLREIWNYIAADNVAAADGRRNFRRLFKR